MLVFSTRVLKKPASDLEGSWTLLTDNFAIKSNVTFTENWTNDISHGDLVRSSPDETFPIDPCNLQMVSKGAIPSHGSCIGYIPTPTRATRSYRTGC